MKPVLIALFLFLCAVTLSAQNDSSFANGQFTTSSGDDIRFSGRAHGGDVRGEITVTGSVTVKVDVDCLLASGNRASLSGTIVESSMPELVGQRSLLVVEDNGQGKNAADRFTWMPVSPADCNAFPPASYVLEAIVDGHVHVKTSNAPF
jgi:hypothetical protein